MILSLLFFALLQPDTAIVRELEQIEQRLADTYKAGDCDAWGAMLAPELM